MANYVDFKYNMKSPYKYLVKGTINLIGYYQETVDASGIVHNRPIELIHTLYRRSTTTASTSRDIQWSYGIYEKKRWGNDGLPSTVDVRLHTVNGVSIPLRWFTRFAPTEFWIRDEVGIEDFYLELEII